MIDAFAAAVTDAERQKALLLAHPDLAGKAAVAGDLGETSRKEQTGAGLDRLTPAEFARFSEMNQANRARHGFPFIYAICGATHQVWRRPGQPIDLAA
jgi:2-oxo-4-hydroxy-4-carboxy-5-ureidoimidazoline decarboxylase